PQARRSVGQGRPAESGRLAPEVGLVAWCQEVIGGRWRAADPSPARRECASFASGESRVVEHTAAPGADPHGDTAIGVVGPRGGRVCAGVVELGAVLRVRVRVIGRLLWVYGAAA